MRFFILTFLLFFTLVFGESSPAIREEIIQTVNTVQSLWKAGVPPKFANATMEDVRMLLGTVLPGDEGYLELPAKMFPDTDGVASTSSFDSRQQWPQCADLMGTARDQSACGSCWAFSSTESFNDRLCIKTGDTTMLSPDDTLSCCSGYKCGFSMGCNGGQPSGAWRWFTENGVVTGGLYESTDSGTTCKPYSFPPCAHHTEEEGLDSCDNYDYSTPKCTSSCTSGSYGTSYSQDKHYAKTSYSVKGVSNIEKELMANGPVSAAFTVYEDFLTYTGGIYQHVTGRSEGGHAVKIIGFGVEDGVEYWTVVNSWGLWGEEGLFRILKGVDECGIESSIVAGEV
jgi:cathepsin B